MSTKKHVDIIIATRDRDEKLRTCLTSLAKALTFDASLYLYNIIIVREHDGKRAPADFFNLIKHPNFRCLNISYITLKNSSNFTKAINAGLLRSLSKKHVPEYIGFLHDDTIVFKGWLDHLIKPMEENLNIYGCGSITSNELDEQCFSKTYSLFGVNDHEILLNEFNEATISNYQHIENRMSKLNYYEFKKNDKTSSKISLFAAVFRKEAFEKFGYFDENLISSFRIEDEFCKRLYENGKTVALVPQAFAQHECFRLSFSNHNLINDKLLRDATLHNIKIKYQLNPIVSKKRNQYVVYTCMDCVETPMLNNIFNYHDRSTTNFICFTERDKIMGETWEIVNIHPFLELEEFKNNKQRFKDFVKLHPHYFFKNYNASVWVDFRQVNMIPFDIKEFIRMMDKNILFMSLESNKFSCSWKYLISRLKDSGLITTHRNVLNLNTETTDPNNSVLSTYRFYNFPHDLGFMDTSVLVTKHNNKECSEILNKIWEKYLNVAADDKMWFNFMLWLYKKNYYNIPFNLYQIKMNEVNKEIDKIKNTKEN